MLQLNYEAAVGCRAEKDGYGNGVSNTFCGAGGYCK